jgi:hypothetical protein
VKERRSRASRRSTLISRLPWNCPNPPFTPSKPCAELLIAGRAAVKFWNEFSQPALAQWSVKRRRIIRHRFIHPGRSIVKRAIDGGPARRIV